MITQITSMGGVASESKFQLELMGDAAAGAAGAMETTSPEIQTFSDAMGVLADETASAEDKTRALKDALDVLNGVQPTMLEAQRDSNEALLDAKDMFKDAEGNVVSYKKAIEKSTAPSTGR